MTGGNPDWLDVGGATVTFVCLCGERVVTTSRAAAEIAAEKHVAGLNQDPTHNAIYDTITTYLRRQRRRQVAA